MTGIMKMIKSNARINELLLSTWECMPAALRLKKSRQNIAEKCYQKIWKILSFLIEVYHRYNLPTNADRAYFRPFLQIHFFPMMFCFILWNHPNIVNIYHVKGILYRYQMVESIWSQNTHEPFGYCFISCAIWFSCLGVEATATVQLNYFNLHGNEGDTVTLNFDLGCAISESVFTIGKFYFKLIRKSSKASKRVLCVCFPSVKDCLFVLLIPAGECKLFSPLKFVTMATWCNRKSPLNCNFVRITEVIYYNKLKYFTFIKLWDSLWYRWYVFFQLFCIHVRLGLHWPRCDICGWLYRPQYRGYPRRSFQFLHSYLPNRWQGCGRWWNILRGDNQHWNYFTACNWRCFSRWTLNFNSYHWGWWFR